MMTRKGEKTSPPDRSASGEMSQLLFVTARPGIQLLWTVLVASVFVYSIVWDKARYPWGIVAMCISYALLLFGNHYVPFKKYRPFAFFLLMLACLGVISSIVYLTGGRASQLSFLFFLVPISAAAYYSYPGTMIVAAATALVRYLPYVSVNVSALAHFWLALTAFAYFVVGYIACYVFEGERMYARESIEYRHLLDLSMEKERDISLIYNVSRKFSYTLELDAVIETTAALARKMLSSDGALVFLSEEGEQHLRAALGTLPIVKTAPTILPEGEGWLYRLRNGEDVVAENVSLEWLPLQDVGGTFGIAAVPMLVGRDVAGYLMCFSPAPRAFKEAHLEVLSTLASQSAVAVEKARLYTSALDEKTKVETILSALREGLLVTDSEGVLIQTNPVAERLLDISSSAIGMPLIEVLEPALRDANLGVYSPREAVVAVLEGRTIFGEISFAGETQAHAQAQFIPLKDQVGGVTGMVLFLHDITELKRIDELKSNFVSNVSHELRTPLTSISGFVSLLLAGRAGSLTPQQSEYLNIVSEQAENLTRMIEDLLDLSRLQARRIKTTIMPANIEQVIKAVSLHLSNSAEANQVELRTRVADDLPLAEADPDRIAQVLTNIISNAIKYTEAGGIVETTVLRNGSFLQVQVTDNGVGIPASALPHIFDRFFQAHSGEVNDRGGFGLGLAISREIVEMHGGKIWADSSEGRGSTFCFTLPVHEK